MNDRNDLYTIGELARRTGLSVRNIRFWSDSGIVPPTDRTATGYRLYDAEAVARLDLVRTLRELGMDLATVHSVLERQTTVADVAAAHVRALDAEIRTLRVRRAVLASVAHRGSTTEEMRLMHKLAKLSAAERQRMIDEFVTKVFEGTDPEAPGAGIAQAMRQMPSELPDDPSPEQVDAWVELAELVGDPDFQASCRAMAVAGSENPEPPQDVDHARLMELVTPDVVENVAPGSDAARRIVDELDTTGLDAQRRRELADRLATFTDRRVERYWQLLAVLNGWPQRENSSVAPFEWFIAALRAY
ncbi:DNA-binding transcriptional MerR regulator [Stackebrandtia albiflava]|uniref:DNA-binding transcriptional MerR regulator n=1 Tax=Stackebrandtia albiflava TaxID=406432 RepID=A0A562VA30_9ACTN|nr:MerR family transcriptional regulator [Stackebrandtia albiflava]TWJ14750.1 DNA-binding transcriptional MerR regulator [Stackebrandtia albiflava]